MKRLTEWFHGTSFKTRIIIAIGIIAFCIGMFYMLKSKSVVKGQRMGELKPTVDVITIVPRDMVRTILLTGQTVPVSQVDIAAKYTGKITQVSVELGQEVFKGQDLIVQDDSDITILLAQNKASLRQAQADAVDSNASFEASYQKAQADYQHSVTNFQRYKTLYEQGAISKESLDNAEQQMNAARAPLDTWSKQISSGNPATVLAKRAASEKAQSVVDALENQKNDLVLRAPRAGIIGFRQAEVGNIAQAGQKLLSIIDNSNIFVDCSVSEQDVGQIPLGSPVNVTVDSLGKSYSGKIIYSSPSMDAKTQTFTMRIALDSLDASIKSGMFARTTITMLLRPQTLFIPKEAIVSSNGVEKIFIVDENGQVTERVATLGLRNDKEVEILSGVSSGEQVAITNLARLKTGTIIIKN